MRKYWQRAMIMSAAAISISKKKISIQKRYLRNSRIKFIRIMKMLSLKSNSIYKTSNRIENATENTLG